MKMNRFILSKPNTTVLRPLLNIFIFLIFISTCSKTPTEGSGNNSATQGLNIYHEISYGEQTLNNIIVKTDTISAYVSYDGQPSIEKLVVFKIINNAQGTLTPTSTLSDSMGVAKSIYNLVYLNQITTDTIINVKIDIGAGNDVSSISVHDTVDLYYELKAIDPLSAVEYFNFYPNNSNLVNLASEELEISIIARDYAGVGVCNIPVRFELIGEISEDNSTTVPNGVINLPFVNTCVTSSSDEESENSDTYGLASIKYTNNGGGVDSLIAKILDPSNDTLYLFADTIRIETVGSTLLINDVASISSNVSTSNIIISNADSIKTDTIFARALDANGAMISGIPFQFTLSGSEDAYYDGATYLSAGGAISDSTGLAYTILNIHPSLFSYLPAEIGEDAFELSITIDIPSTEISSNVDLSVINNLPFWYANSAHFSLSTETYILPSENGATFATITATLQDSLMNYPPPGTIIEFSSLQKDTTGTSGEGEGFQWMPIGNIAPGTTFNSNGEATVDFHMQNDRGIAHIIGTVANYDISDTIQIIIESTDASHINILSPDQDEIMVQGGGGIEYSEIFVQITDNLGNIVYDKPYQVKFKLTGAPDGTTLESSTDTVIKVAESGESSVTIVSGTRSGSVHLTVSLFNETDNELTDPITTAESYPLTVVSGPPEYGEINFGPLDWALVPGSGVVEYPLSVYFTDVYSNPVADSISVYFQLREKVNNFVSTIPYDSLDKVTWLPPGSSSTTLLDSIVYTCINTGGCPIGVLPDTDGTWTPSLPPAQITGAGETGMENPDNLEPYPGFAYAKINFGTNSISTEVIVFAQTYYADNSLLIVDSRTNHAGDGINLPCLGCTIELVANPTNWDFSLPPYNTGVDNVDVMPVTITAVLLDHFNTPLFNLPLRIVAEGNMAFPNGYIYACNGEDTDLDGITGVCQHAVTGTPHSPLVADCWTCVNDFSPTFIWASDTGDDLELARTSTQGKARWIVQYSELINFPLTGTSPNATWTNQTVTISVDLDDIIAFPEIENTTVDININKTERD